MENEIVIFLTNNILPDPPTGTLQDILTEVVSFFRTWIIRLGGLVAFIGAIKFAISIQSDDAREQLGAIMTMISGFMIQAAVRQLDIFKVDDYYNIYAANEEFQAILDFIKVWARRVGALAMFSGAVMFGFSMKDNNATTKVKALRFIAVGGIIISVTALLPFFV